MPTPIVIDLSHHNTIPESLIDTAASGIVGVIHKATEGSTYVDNMVDNRWYLAKQAGLLWGTYHFMRPGDMKKQAAFYVDITNKNGDENTLLCADHEDEGVSLNDLKVWLKEVERLTGRKPIIYSGHVLKGQLPSGGDPEISGYLLWLAQYASKPTLPPGFARYWLWQYTDEGSVPGVKPPTDLNDGVREDVVAAWSGSGEPMPGPTPEPEPVAGEVHIEVTTTPGVSVTVVVNDVAVVIDPLDAELGGL